MVSIRVWDLPIRLFHWTLVLLVIGSLVTGWFSSELGLGAAELHPLFGYAVLALLLFRLAWGFVGSTYARFGSFLRGPQTVMHYLGELTGRRDAQPRLGHNPLGGWASVLLLSTLAVQAASGLVISDEDLGVEGPLAKYVGSAMGDRLGELHETNFALLLFLIVLHLGAIAYHRFAKGENLVKPMITGIKHLPSAPEGADGRGGHPSLAIVLLLCSAGIVWYVVNRL